MRFIPKSQNHNKPKEHAIIQCKSKPSQDGQPSIEATQQTIHANAKLLSQESNLSILTKGKKLTCPPKLHARSEKALQIANNKGAEAQWTCCWSK